jgi:parallel beta-helix repeat protein
MDVIGMNHAKSIALALVILNILIFAQPALATNDPPPAGGWINGNWTVTDSRAYSNVWIGVNRGNIIIQNGGSLTFDNVDLYMVLDWSGQFQIEVQSGGTLNIVNGSWLYSNNGDRHFYLRVRAGANATFANSTFNQLGYQWDTTTQNNGLYIAADNASVDNCTFNDVSYGVTLDNTDAPVTSCTFRNFQYAAIAPIYSNSLIWNNTMTYIKTSPNPWGIDCSGGQPTISGNSMWTLTGAIYLYDSTANVTQNTISDCYYGIYLYAASPNITENRILGNLYGNIMYDRSDPLIANNTFDNNEYFGLLIQDHCNPIVQNNYINRSGWNYYSGWGAGAYYDDHCNGEFSNNTVYNPWRGHGMQVSSSTLKMENCNINATEQPAIRMGTSASPTIVNCTFYSGLDPALVASGECQPMLTDCTFTSNAAPGNNNWDPALLLDNYATPTMTRCKLVSPGYIGAYVDHYAGLTLKDCQVNSYSEALYGNNYASVEAERCMLRAANGFGVHLRDHAILKLADSNITSNDVAVYMDWERCDCTIINSSIVSTSATAFVVDWGTARSERSSITAHTNAAVYLSGGSLVDLVNSTVRGFTQDVYLDWGTNMVNFTNVSFDQFKVRFVEATSALNVFWYLGIRATWQNGVPVEGAEFNVTNITGKYLFNGTTDAKGENMWNLVQEYHRTQGQWENYTSHYINAVKNNIKKTVSASIRTNMVVPVPLTDADNPTVAILYPTNGQIFNVSSFVVNGTASDSGSGLSKVEYNIDGGNWTDVEGMEVWSTKVELADGLRTIRARAYDVAGKSLETSVTVRIDTYISLELQSPENGALFNTTMVNVTGKAEAQANVTVNGVRATQDSDGNFEVTLTLREGKQDIVAVAEDAAGNIISDRRTVTVDTIPPGLELDYPNDGLNLSTHDVVFRGMTDPGVLLLIGGRPFLTELNGSFAALLTLPEGNNSITVKAVDAAGNFRSITILVRVDTTPPTIKVTSPANDYLTNNPTITITGETDGDAIYVGGEKASLTAGIFQKTLQLVEGLNIIGFRGLDILGNEATGTISVTLDTQPPLLVVIHPPVGFVTNNANLVVTGVTEFGANVTLNELPALVQNGMFNSTVLLQSGQNIITVKAIDRAGNVAVVTRTAVLDQSPPGLTISEPSSGARTENSKITVRGTTDPGCTVTVNGVTAKVDGLGGFTAEIPLSDGDNSIFVVSVDPAGNPTSKTMRVSKRGALAITRDETPMILMAIILGIIVGAIIGVLVGRRRKAVPEAPDEPDFSPNDEDTHEPRPPAGVMDSARKGKKEYETHKERDVETFEDRLDAKSGPGPASIPEAQSEVPSAPAEPAPVPEPEPVNETRIEPTGRPDAPAKEPKPSEPVKEAPQERPKDDIGTPAEKPSPEAEKKIDESLEDILKRLQT